MSLLYNDTFQLYNTRSANLASEVNCLVVAERGAFENIMMALLSANSFMTLMMIMVILKKFFHFSFPLSLSLSVSLSVSLCLSLSLSLSLSLILSLLLALTFIQSLFIFVLQKEKGVLFG